MTFPSILLEFWTLPDSSSKEMRASSRAGNKSVLQPNLVAPVIASLRPCFAVTVSIVIDIVKHHSFSPRSPITVMPDKVYIEAIMVKVKEAKF